MLEEKPWWQSKTIWANLALVAVTLARSFGIVSGDAADAIVAEVPEYITSLVAAALGLYGVYGRFVAKTKVTAT